MSLQFPSFAKNEWIAFGNDLLIRSEYDSVRLLIAFVNESKGDVRFAQWIDSIIEMIASAENDSAFDSALHRGMSILWHSSFSSEKMNARVNVVRSRVRTENAPKRKDFRSLPSGKIVAGFREAKKNSVSSGAYGDYGISTNGKCSIDSPRFKDSRINSIDIQNVALQKERSFASANRPNNGVRLAKVIRGDAFDQTPRKVADAKKRIASKDRSVERSSFDILSDIVRENRIK